MKELRNPATRHDLLSLIGVAQKSTPRHADDLAIITPLRLLMKSVTIRCVEVHMSKPLKFQIIERAKEIIQDERHWCRGYLAMDVSGDSADPTSSDAVRRCALGALIAAAYQLTNDRVRGYQLALNALRPLCGSNTVVLTNDHRGHAAVLALFDEAMAAM
jgi:hypothetical protein